MTGCSDKSAVGGGNCRRTGDRCKAAAVVGHIVDPTSAAADGVFCNEHGRRSGQYVHSWNGSSGQQCRS